ncbi:MAG: TetM/TetW/TetO/TetS family tetracycline resistance ribosomal protection protein [Oscillospiraceae bacterium]|nr:TetM/TetW/TetO/TetS family tetracycline resistance ribosomal protection protein [Oscillospiraceae bacterium]
MEERKRRLTVGMLAHVDAGKTTLSEALLYAAGAILTRGRVDHGDAFLDTDAQERERGITIFSKQAVFSLPGLDVTLIDTPGHVDFSGEAERVLGVLDCAVLVVSGTDGVQSHTLTLWRLLERYGVPAFLFVNKTDLPGADRGQILAELRGRFGDGCVGISGDWYESAALLKEEALSEYLETGALSDRTASELVAERKLFPCFFGSALKGEGVDALLDGLSRFAPEKTYPEAFSALVYKIARDRSGARLTYMKITGGELRVKDVVAKKLSGETVWEEKADQLRLYSGDKFKTADCVPAGGVCAVTGLTQTRAGDALGAAVSAPGTVLEPVSAYRLVPENCDPLTAMQRLRVIEEEEPLLHAVWDASLGEIRVHLMGEVQREVLQRQLRDRFGMEASFAEAGVLYRETIRAPVEGVGHYEPLRHYAEVHLLLEPGEKGSGLRFSSACSEDELDLNWQRLILTHLREKEHVGVLTGSPITDMRVTLVSGRAHVKHTEGGDFRQATYRAVRQGLMAAESVLLEPWYAVTAVLPTECAGRAISDIQNAGGELFHRDTVGDTAILEGRGPVSKLRSYPHTVAAYTHGRGRISFTFSGYEPCPDAETVVAASGYDPEHDLENPADSVFCSHGTGSVVKWYDVPAHMHLPSIMEKKHEPEERPVSHSPSPAYTGTLEQDQELMRIFERTYGEVKPRSFLAAPPRAEAEEPETREIAGRPDETEYLLVDGYNVIFAWDELKGVAGESLDAARAKLAELLCNYQGFRKCEVILVFDAYKVPKNPGSVEKYHNITIVYTKEAETADSYIEKATYELGRHSRVRVATSDGMEQLIILGHGAMRVPATAFHAEMESVLGRIADIVQNSARRENPREIEKALKRAEEKRNGE